MLYDSVVHLVSKSVARVECESRLVCVTCAAGSIVRNLIWCGVGGWGTGPNLPNLLQPRPTPQRVRRVGKGWEIGNIHDVFLLGLWNRTPELELQLQSTRVNCSHVLHVKDHYWIMIITLKNEQ